MKKTILVVGHSIKLPICETRPLLKEVIIPEPPCFVTILDDYNKSKKKKQSRKKRNDYF